MSQKIREILDNLVAKIMHKEEGQMLDVKYSEDYPRDYAQAHQAIISAILEKMPKEKEYGYIAKDTGRKIMTKEIEAYNQALTEMRERIEQI